AKSGTVVMSAPLSGAKVSGMVSITCSDSVSNSWIDFYIDGGYLTSGPPYTVSWASTKVSNASHTISCKGFHGSSILDGTASATVTVSNGTPTPTSTPRPTPTPTPAPSGVPRESHVFLLLEENHSFAQVTASSMPYLTSLKSKAAIATNYF